MSTNRNENDQNNDVKHDVILDRLHAIAICDTHDQETSGTPSQLAAMLMLASALWDEDPTKLTLDVEDSSDSTSSIITTCYSLSNMGHSMETTNSSEDGDDDDDMLPSKATILDIPPNTPSTESQVQKHSEVGITPRIWHASQSFHDELLDMMDPPPMEIVNASQRDILRNYLFYLLRKTSATAMSSEMWLMNRLAPVIPSQQQETTEKRLELRTRSPKLPSPEAHIHTAVAEAHRSRAAIVPNYEEYALLLPSALDDWPPLGYKSNHTTNSNSTISNADDNEFLELPARITFQTTSNESGFDSTNNNELNVELQTLSTLIDACEEHDSSFCTLIDKRYQEAALNITEASKPHETIFPSTSVLKLAYLIAQDQLVSENVANRIAACLVYGYGYAACGSAVPMDVIPDDSEEYLDDKKSNSDLDENQTSDQMEDDSINNTSFIEQTSSPLLKDDTDKDSNMDSKMIPIVHSYAVRAMHDRDENLHNNRYEHIAPADTEAVELAVRLVSILDGSLSKIEEWARHWCVFPNNTDSNKTNAQRTLGTRRKMGTGHMGRTSQIDKLEIVESIINDMVESVVEIGHFIENEDDENIDKTSDDVPTFVSPICDDSVVPQQMSDGPRVVPDSEHNGTRQRHLLKQLPSPNTRTRTFTSGNNVSNMSTLRAAVVGARAHVLVTIADLVFDELVDLDCTEFPLLLNRLHATGNNAYTLTELAEWFSDHIAQCEQQGNMLRVVQCVETMSVSESLTCVDDALATLSRNVILGQESNTHVSYTMSRDARSQAQPRSSTFWRFIVDSAASITRTWRVLLSETPIRSNSSAPIQNARWDAWDPLSTPISATSTTIPTLRTTAGKMRSIKTNNIDEQLAAERVITLIHSVERVVLPLADCLLLNHLVCGMRLTSTTTTTTTTTTTRTTTMTMPMAMAFVFDARFIRVARDVLRSAYVTLGVAEELSNTYREELRALRQVCECVMKLMPEPQLGHAINAVLGVL